MAVADERSEGTARRKARDAAPLLAALDLGTNNCRLLIARPSHEGRWRVVDSFSRMVRLGEGLAQTGVLSDAAIQRAVDALKVCGARIARYEPERVRAVATEAVRRARNGAVLVVRAREEAGIALEIVSTEEEAHLAALGAAPLLGRRYRGALVFDIGGGSTEIVWLRRRGKKAKNIFSASVPVGVATLPADIESYAALQAEVRPLFAQVRRRMARVGEFKPRSHHLLGASGTVTTLAGIEMGLPRYDRSKVDASWHRVKRLLAIADEVAKLDVGARAKVPCIGAERAELMLPGLAIFAAICAEWLCEEMRVADRGLREGILRELLESL